MRTEDIFACVRFLRQRFAGSPAIELVASGEAAVPALHAAFLEKDRFVITRLDGGIPSWQAVVAERRAQDQLINCVHAALEWYDLPDLVNALGTDKVTVENTRIPTF